MSKEPNVNGENGKDEKGQFVEGNNAAKGHSTKAQEKGRELKRALLDAVSVDDIKAIIAKLVEKGKSGDVKAAKEVLDRCFGKAKETHEHTGEVGVTFPPEVIALGLKMAQQFAKDSK